MPIKSPATNFRDLEDIRSRLKLKHLESKSSFSSKYRHIEKYLKSKGLDIGKIRTHSSKLLGASILTGALLFAIPKISDAVGNKHEISVNKSEDDKISESEKLVVNTIKTSIPKTPRPLDRNEEKLLEQVFSQTMGVKSKANLEGEHLNTTYGYIGLEQHLRRYPGDTIENHGTPEEIKEGMAPGLGAWGYFAPSKDKLTPELVNIEKYYAVVQTLYLPDWNTRHPYLRNWYKYRKVLIVNTENGNAVVAAIADAGPAAWTGKQFGGSPEVMQKLGGKRYTKGKVLLFFVDDPTNQVELGPVNY